MGILKQSGPLAAILGAAAAVVTLARGVSAVRADELSVTAQSQDASSNDEWGPESDGIRCRLVAISARTNDEMPDLKAKVDAFATADEVTFGVELKNVSDKPITLLGVRYDDTYKEVAGKLRTEELGPQWFEFELSDIAGTRIRRASRTYQVGDWIFLRESSAHLLAPGQSLTLALRPARFRKPLAYRLPTGTFSVRVRYHGPTEENRKKFAERQPDSPQASAWTGEVTSNSIALSVAGGPAATSLADLPWGEESNGLRAAVEVRPRREVGGDRESPGDVPFNSVVDVALHLENVSKRPISLFTEGEPAETLAVSALTRRLEGDWGRVLASANTGIPVVIQWTLRPGETAEIATVRCALVGDEAAAAQLKRSIRDAVRVERGPYKLRYTLHLGGVQLGPVKSGWQGGLTTGELLIVVR